MKKFFFAALLGFGCAGAFSSCNNGQYDSNPDVNNSNVSNPIAPVGTAGKGEVRCKINGVTQTFTAAKYAELISGTRSAFAMRSASGKTHSVSFSFLDYQGVKKYDPQLSEVDFVYSIGDPNDLSNVESYRTFLTIGNGEMKVESDANNEMKGTFSFTAYRQLPEPSTTDSIKVTEGTFYLTKQ